MSTFLEALVDGVRERMAAWDARLPDLAAQAEHAPAVRPLREALLARKLGVIAEFKRASPSKGDLSPLARPEQVARAYAAAGASAISVLTEPERFKGSLEDLTAARAAAPLPALQKDFILEERQIYAGRAAGADAVLLIVAAIGERIFDLLPVVEELGMEALVEVHDEEQIELALDAGASLIGVNSRDLETFEVDLAVAERLLPKLARESVLAVAESGLKSARDVARVRAAGARAILVGEALMTADDPALVLGELLADVD